MRKSNWLSNMAKKVLAVSLSFAMAFANVGVVAIASDDVTDAPVETEAPVNGFYCGDVDMNGEITADDALAILKHVVKLAEITDEDALVLADVNHDGEVTADDALTALQMVVGLKDKVVCQPTETEAPTEDPTEVPTEEPTEVPTEEPTEVPTEEPTTAPTTGVLGVVDFETEDSIVDQNAAGNNSSVDSVSIGSEATSKVLTLGVGASDDSDPENVIVPGGVVVPNLFAGHYELCQTLQDGLNNANAKLAGNIKKALVLSGTGENAYYQVTDADPADLGITAYPTPKYTNGLTVSAWVKMPETANEYDNKDAVILSFSRNTAAAKAGALMVLADGTIGFMAGSNGNNFKRNAVGYNTEGTGALATPGEWTYVTLSIENSQIRVFFNGEEASTTPLKNYMGTNGKMFNKGFSFVGYDDPMTVKDRRQNYRDLLKAFTAEDLIRIIEAGQTSPEDIEKFEYLNSDQELLVDWVVDEDTELYVGGVDAASKVSLTSNNWQQDAAGAWYDAGAYDNTYKDTVAGMQVDDITFTASASDEAAAAAAYAAATAHTSGVVAPVSEFVHFEDNRYIEEMASAANGSKIENVEIADGVKSNVLTFGATTTDAENEITPMGVQIRNGFAGHYELTQTLAEALKNGNTPFAGDILAATSFNATGNPKWTLTDMSKITSYPKAAYTNGLTLSAWAKMPEDVTAADGKAPILTFSRNTAAAKAGALVLTADGSIGFMAGSNGNNFKRNAVAYYCEGADLITEAGEWVYVTLTFQNNQIKLYLNGEEATATPSSNFTGTNGKMFNKGFSYVGNDDPLTNGDRQNNYRDLFKNFTDEEVHAAILNGSTDLYDKMEFLNSAQELLVDWLVDEDTLFYVGGTANADKVAWASQNWQQDAAGQWYDADGFDTVHTDSLDGLQIDDISFDGYCMTAEDVAAAFESATVHHTGYVQPINGTVNFESNAGIASLNADANNAVIEEITLANNVKTKVLKLGKGVTSDSEENPINPMGVEISNPFAGHYEMGQTLTQGLIAADAKLETTTQNGLKSLLNFSWGSQYWQVSDAFVEGTTYPVPKYSNAAVVSAWVKGPATGKDSHAVLFSFSKYTAATKQGALVVTADGNVAFQEGYTNNNLKRNALLYLNNSDEVLVRPNEWAYITLVIENFGVRLFKNGVEVPMKNDGNYTGTNAKMFNKGFSNIMNQTWDDASNTDRRGNMRDLFINFTTDEVTAFANANSTAGADVSKFTFLNSSGTLLIDWLMDEDTLFYVGGVDSTINQTFWGKNSLTIDTKYDDNSEGMIMDDLSFYATYYGIDAAVYADEAYKNATPHADIVVPVTSDDPVTSEEPWEIEPTAQA